MNSLNIIFTCLIAALIILPRSAPAQTQYKEIKVQNGGTIRGVVRLAPNSSGLVRVMGNISSLNVTKDAEFCGKKKSVERLIVGRNRGVQNAVVYIEKIGRGKKRSERRKAVLNQRLCEYEPHVLILPAGDQLEIVNSDRVLHNVHTYTLGEKPRTVFNIAQPIKGQKTLIPQTQLSDGVFFATCDAGHPWMTAYIVHAPHPYYTLTDKDGNFTLQDVPPGAYRVKMWHEGIAVTRVEEERGIPKKYHFEEPYEETKEVVVPAQETSRLDFELTLRTVAMGR